MKTGVLIIAVLLAGCAAAAPPEPVVKTVTVNVPVTVPCKKDIGPEPQYADTDAALRAAPNLYERVRLLVAGRLQRIQREADRIAAYSGCN